MFDFLLTEEWWMDTLVTTIITASAAIVAAIIAGTLSNRKIDKTIALHDKDLSHHEKLSGDRRSALSGEHRQLAQAGQQLGKQISDVATTATYLKEEQLREAGKVSELKDAQQELHQSARQIGEFAKAFTDLAAENSELKQEIKTLRQEIQQLKNKGRDWQRPSRKNNHDLEL